MEKVKINGFGYLWIYKKGFKEGSKEAENPLRAFVGASSGYGISSFTLLESPTINGGNNINKASSPKQKRWS